MAYGESAVAVEEVVDKQDRDLQGFQFTCGQAELQTV